MFSVELIVTALARIAVRFRPILVPNCAHVLETPPARPWSDRGKSCVITCGNLRQYIWGKKDCEYIGSYMRSKLTKLAIVSVTSAQIGERIAAGNAAAQ